MSRRCAVIGSPVEHSRSPQLHRAGYEWLGLDWTYERFQVQADDVVSFVAGLDESWRGLSVTMPCKQAILVLGEPDPVVEALGVGNTVVFGGVPSDRGATHIYNTDVSGLALVLSGRVGGLPVTVLGNGATARSCVYALAGLGVDQVRIRARDAGKTEGLARRAAAWGIEVVAAADGPLAGGVISTVPSALGVEWIAGADLAWLFDIVYDPWPTPLMTAGLSRGVPVMTGFDLLTAQAVGQLELMTGRAVPLSVLQAAVPEMNAPR